MLTPREGDFRERIYGRVYTISKPVGFRERSLQNGNGHGRIQGRRNSDQIICDARAASGVAARKRDAA
jgi:hypothetical protein